MIELAFILSVIVVIFYVWLVWNRNYWRNLGIDQLESSIVFGNVGESMMMKKSFADVYHSLYRRSSKPAVGIMKMRKPQLLIRDPELVRIFLVTEFSSFYDNAYYTEPSDFLYSKHPFFLKGEEWKKSRGLSSPALTPSKVKNLVPQLVSICQELITHINKNCDKPFEIQTLANQYTTDTIIRTIFGLHSNAIEDPNTPFRTKLNDIFIPDFWGSIKFTISSYFPSIARFFKLKLTPKSFVHFYTSVVDEAVNYRKANGVTRNDYLQHLIDTSGKDGKQETSSYDMTACCMTIMIDGVETSGLAITHFLDLLARNPEIQSKIRDEFKQNINSVQEITYDNISSLKYLNAAYWETLRIRPPVPLVQKVCTKDIDINFKGYNYKLKKDTEFAVSFEAIQMDSNYFPRPEEFIPERFIDGNDDEALLPFGIGPRACMGKLLGTMQVKIMIASILNHFEVVPEKENSPVVFDEKSTFLKSLKHGCNVYFKKI